jgi:hypothetical protein
VGIYRSCQKRNSLSLHNLLPTGRHLLDALFITGLKVKFMHRSNHTGHCIVSHAQNTTVLDLNVYVIGTGIAGNKQRTFSVILAFCQK